MHAVTGLSLLVLAGSALAAPLERKVVYYTKVHTVTVTGAPEGAYQATVTPQETKYAVPEPTIPSTSIVAIPTDTNYSDNSEYVEESEYSGYEPSSTQAEYSDYQPSSTQAAAPSYGAPSYDAPVESATPNTGYMSVVAEWRMNLGLEPLTQDSQLEANALKTCENGKGEMVHELNPGSMGQVLAPGESGDFYHVFVGGWLCERPGLAGLNGVCSEQSEGWTYGGQTGHADILTSPSYSKIGCANSDGIWSCDLA